MYKGRGSERHSDQPGAAQPRSACSADHGLLPGAAPGRLGDKQTSSCIRSLKGQDEVSSSLKMPRAGELDFKIIRRKNHPAGKVLEGDEPDRPPPCFACWLAFAVGGAWMAGVGGGGGGLAIHTAPKGGCSRRCLPAPTASVLASSRPGVTRHASLGGSFQSFLWMCTCTGARTPFSFTQQSRTLRAFPCVFPSTWRGPPIRLRKTKATVLPVKNGPFGVFLSPDTDA